MSVSVSTFPTGYLFRLNLNLHLPANMSFCLYRSPDPTFVPLYVSVYLHVTYFVTACPFLSVPVCLSTSVHPSKPDRLDRPRSTLHHSAAHTRPVSTRQILNANTSDSSRLSPALFISPTHHPSSVHPPSHRLLAPAPCPLKV